MPKANYLHYISKNAPINHPSFLVNLQISGKSGRQTVEDEFDRIDDELEAQYGARYPLRPGRPRQGSTANKEHDGLFNVGAAFSAGYGSQHGPGYVVEMRMSTLKPRPPEVEEAIHAHVVRRLEAWLPEAFPGRDLRVEREGSTYKIVGDLGLD